MAGPNDHEPNRPFSISPIMRPSPYPVFFQGRPAMLPPSARMLFMADATNGRNRLSGGSCHRDRSAPAALFPGRLFIEETLPDPGAGRSTCWVGRAGSPTWWRCYRGPASTAPRAARRRGRCGMWRTLPHEGLAPPTLSPACPARAKMAQLSAVRQTLGTLNVTPFLTWLGVMARRRARSHSDTVFPVPPNSEGKSLNFVRPSFMGITVSP